MASPKPDTRGGASRISSSRKLGRPFKAGRERAGADSSDKTQAAPLLLEGLSRTGTPPALPYRSFKIALAVFRQQGALPERLDRSAFSNKLRNTSVREIVEAYRFLGLIDADLAPTAAFTALVRAVDTPAWAGTLLGVIEQSYQHLLACDPIAVTDGLHRAFRLVYEAGAENTRRRSSFFLHACRDVANAQPNDEFVREMPVYDAAWPEQMKRQWFGTFHDLVQRLNS